MITSKKRKEATDSVHSSSKSQKTKSSKQNTLKPEEINLNFKNQSWDPERRVKGKVWPKLKKILEMEDYASYPPNEPTYISIEAPPSSRPIKRYCDITGYVSHYRDPKTRLYYATSKEYHYIVNNLTTHESVQQYLQIRGAHDKYSS